MKNEILAKERTVVLLAVAALLGGPGTVRATDIAGPNSASLDGLGQTKDIGQTSSAKNMGQTSSAKNMGQSASGAGSTISSDASRPASNSAAAIGDDVVLRAFTDELARTEKRLTLEGHPPPYFASYLGKEHEQYNVYGSFGALDKRTNAHQRSIDIDVRVGDRKLDSSGGQMFGFGDFGEFGGESALDDNYDAIRHDLWLRTDGAYKHAIEGLEAKKALLQQKKIEDLSDSMVQSPPIVSINPRVHLVLDKAKWDQNMRDISAVFKEYPQVINSEVTLISRARTRWLASSEGALDREGDQGILVGMTASAQARDGMNVADFEMCAASNQEQLPTCDELKASARELARRVTALSNAPIIEDYRGPILFEKQAAAEFFAQTLSPNLVNPSENLLRMAMHDAGLKEKLGRRILPVSVTVTDDPGARDFHGIALKGGYLVDDEGVRGQKIELVQNGILKTLCSGRTPSKYVKDTNGHWRDNAALPSQLFVSSSESAPLSVMKQRLMQMGKEDGLKYVLIARRISSLYLRFLDAGEPGFEGMLDSFRPDQLSLAPPTLLYKVNVDDGSEELLRGARFEHLTSRIWRDIVGFGDDAQPYIVLNALPTNSTSSSLVTPSILISEIDVTRQSRETDKPVLLKNPYFEKAPPKGSFSAMPPG